MCSDLVIDVKNLSKRYDIYAKPRDRLLQFLWRGRKQFYKEFWALHPTSFQVRRGETVGLLGKNGSGKSTLLQLICGTLSPTGGAVTTSGRVAALLELGSGFNHEFSGRENIYLNGSILGMGRSQIDDRLDDIINFADIGEHIDQPVKTYSSGMMLRLAFAVQVQLEPQVLIIDEALAVGDSGFQLKCMLRMQELQRQGTTILFVSHDMSAVARLCDRAILLDKGSVVEDSTDCLTVIREYDRMVRGTPSSLIPRYESAETQCNSEPKLEDVNYSYELSGVNEVRMGSGEARYLSVDFIDETGSCTTIFRAGTRITIRAAIKSVRNFPRVVSGFTLKNRAGVDVWGDNNIAAQVDLYLECGINYISYSFNLYIPPGDYFLYIGLADITGERVELDQRWPVRKLTITSERATIGFVYAPAQIDFWRES